MFDIEERFEAEMQSRAGGLSAEADSMEPGPFLAVVLAGVDPDGLDAENRVRAVKAYARQVAHYQAMFYRAVAAVVDAYDEGFGDPRWAPDGASAELQASLRMTRRAADTEVDLALELRHRMPAVWEAMRRGQLDRRRALTFSHGTGHLDDDTTRRLTDDGVDDAARLTTGQLAARLRRLCIEADPGQAARRYDYATEQRRVVMESGPDGTAHLHIFDLPAHHATAAVNHINHIARQLHGRLGEDRTMDQLKADIAGDLLGGVGPRTVRGGVEITVDLTTLGRLSDHPGELAGYGPVIADIARQLTADNTDTPWTYTITHPDTDRSIATGAVRRRPTTAQRRAITARSRTCIFPGCRMPSISCDLDHRIPHGHGGPTSCHNLDPLCRYHHNIRHHTGWTHRPLPNGDHLWTSPLGATHTTSGTPP